MKSVLLLGLGRFGTSVALKLCELGHEVMAVDRNEEKVNDILPYVTNALIGDSTDEKFLKQLDGASYDLCIVSIGRDFQSSLITTSTLKEMGAKTIISMAANNVQEKLLLRNGADYVVFPEKQIGEWTAIRYTADHILDFIEIDDEYAIFELEIPPDWLGKTIIQLDVRRKYNINILALRKNGKSNMSIMGDTLLEKGYTLLVLGKYNDIKKCFKI